MKFQSKSSLLMAHLGRRDFEVHIGGRVAPYVVRPITHTSLLPSLIHYSRDACLGKYQALIYALVQNIWLLATYSNHLTELETWPINCKTQRWHYVLIRLPTGRQKEAILIHKTKTRNGLQKGEIITKSQLSQKDQAKDSR